MRYTGSELRMILRRQRDPVEILDANGRRQVVYQDQRRAADLVSRGIYYGVGNAKRIRFIRLESGSTESAPWGADLDLGEIAQKPPPRRGPRTTETDRLRWAPRPDKAKTGTVGGLRRVWMTRRT
jgi:hypothetical protein